MKFEKKLVKLPKKNLIVIRYILKYRAKIKSYKGKINTNFHKNKIPKGGSQYICLSVILLGSIFKAGKSCYPQVFLQECKCVTKENVSYGMHFFRGMQVCYAIILLMT